MTQLTWLVTALWKEYWCGTYRWFSRLHKISWEPSDIEGVRRIFRDYVTKKGNQVKYGGDVSVIHRYNEYKQQWGTKGYWLSVFASNLKKYGWKKAKEKIKNLTATEMYAEYKERHGESAHSMDLFKSNCCKYGITYAMGKNVWNFKKNKFKGEVIALREKLGKGKVPLPWFERQIRLRWKTRDEEVIAGFLPNYRWRIFVPEWVVPSERLYKKRLSTWWDEERARTTPSFWHWWARFSQKKWMKYYYEKYSEANGDLGYKLCMFKKLYFKYWEHAMTMLKKRIKIEVKEIDPV